MLLEVRGVELQQRLLDVDAYAASPSHRYQREIASMREIERQRMSSVRGCRALPAGGEPRLPAGFIAKTNRPGTDPEVLSKNCPQYAARHDESAAISVKSEPSSPRDLVAAQQRGKSIPFPVWHVEGSREDTDR